MGSMDAARRAGRNDASAAAVIRIPIADIRQGRLNLLTPYNLLEMSFATPKTSGTPMMIPNPTCAKALRMNFRTAA